MYIFILNQSEVNLLIVTTQRPSFYFYPLDKNEKKKSPPNIFIFSSLLIPVHILTAHFEPLIFPSYLNLSSNLVVPGTKTNTHTWSLTNLKDSKTLSKYFTYMNKDLHKFLSFFFFFFFFGPHLYILKFSG